MEYARDTDERQKESRLMNNINVGIGDTLMDAQELTVENRKLRLEVWKTWLSILTPIVLLVLGWRVNDAIQERGAFLKRQEQVLAEKQRVYGELGRKLNVMYVYV